MGSVGYQRHRPEQTLLYQIVERHYPAFTDHLAETGKQLPAHVRQAFYGYLRCCRLEHGSVNKGSERIYVLVSIFAIVIN